jgi:hypothetical protein
VRRATGTARDAGLLRPRPRRADRPVVESVLVLAAAVVALVWNWRIFSVPQDHDRSLKFLRAGYVWLLVSIGMLVLLPVHQHGLLGLLAPDSAAARLGFSHAYYGAIRHAITVGFVSLMIVGVAAKVVPEPGMAFFPGAELVVEIRKSARNGSTNSPRTTPRQRSSARGRPSWRSCSMLGRTTSTSS